MIYFPETYRELHIIRFKNVGHTQYLTVEAKNSIDIFLHFNVCYCFNIESISFKYVGVWENVRFKRSDRIF